VVAEFVAGTGGAETGLAFRILESGYRLAIPRMFAALLMLSVTGIVIWARKLRARVTRRAEDRSVISTPIAGLN
jgi:ABC-type nitrate/sulfonate/bicarbonate transport system permease component